MFAIRATTAITTLYALLASSLLCVTLLGAQTTTPSGTVERIGAGVTPPQLLEKVEPEFTAQARDALVQGTVVLEIVVDEEGRATDITVLSPLGFGLDEQAQRAIEQWRFRPGVKDGKTVKVRAVVEANFRFRETWFDGKAERRRTRFNLSLNALRRNEPKSVERAVKAIEELSSQSFPPAMYLFGKWLETGEHVAKDQARGVVLIRKSADKNYGPALYELGRWHLDGQGVPKDPDQGMQLIRDAAVLGSNNAQFFLGHRYESGDGVTKDVERSRRYFRLCASGRQRECQYRLAASLLRDEPLPERQLVQAVAWLQLSAEQGMPEVTARLDREASRLKRAPAGMGESPHEPVDETALMDSAIFVSLNGSGRTRIEGSGA